MVQRQRMRLPSGSGLPCSAGGSPALGARMQHAVSTSSLFWGSTGATHTGSRPAFAAHSLKVQSLDPELAGSRSPGAPARHYIESLHQSLRGSSSSLLFGKNNVFSQPREDLPKLPGYLSLHAAVEELVIKWTPNALMSGGVDNSSSSVESLEPIPKIEWSCAVIIWMSSIVSIHCHRQVEKGDMLILVNRDGSQNPPFHFPAAGNHLISFLSCLETNLLPGGRLDPPLYTRINKETLVRHIEEECRSDGPKSADNVTVGKRRSIVFFWGGSQGNEEGKSTSFSSFPSWTWSRPSGSSPSAPAANHQLSSLAWLQPRGFGTRLRMMGALRCGPDRVGMDTVAFPPATASAAAVTAPGQDGLTGSSDSACDGHWETDMLFRVLRTPRRHDSQDSGSDTTTATEGFEDEPNSPFSEGGSCFHDGLSLTGEAGAVGRCQRPSKRHRQRTVTSWHSQNITDVIRERCLQDNDEQVSNSGVMEQQRQTRRQRHGTLVAGSRSLGTNPTGHQRSCSIRRLCSSMRREILARSFYGWLAYCRHMKTIRGHLSQLVMPLDQPYDKAIYDCGLSQQAWSDFISLTRTPDAGQSQKMERFVYWGGCDPEIRTEVWPFLLGVYSWSSDSAKRRKVLRQWERRYDMAVSEWMVVEAVLDDSGVSSSGDPPISDADDSEDVESGVMEIERDAEKYENEREDLQKLSECSQEPWQTEDKIVITKEVLLTLKQSLSRIEKDVARCDRHYPYFGQTEAGERHLGVLHRLMCAWVWEHFQVGYIQGMCDILAPVLVVYSSTSGGLAEEMVYACFCKLMERMLPNFPARDSNKMDLNFSRMRSAVDILDSDLLEHMQNHGDFTHFYFSYRWFLLDFKREFSYEDIFCMWEVMWAAEKLTSPSFSLFVGLSLLLSYRDIILDNDMEFTDIIRFFNEMAEQHDVRKIVDLARELVEKLQVLLHS